MAVTEVHACFELIAENEKFRRRLHSLAKENKELKKRLSSFEEKQKIQILVKQSVHTRCIETQTEPIRGGGGGISANRFPSTKPVKKAQDEQDQLSKLTVQHANLLRQYEQQVKSSLKHIEEISSLTMKVLELEQKLAEAQSKWKERRTEKKSELVKTDDRRGCSCLNSAAEETLRTDISRLQLEMNSLQGEKLKLEKQYKSLKSELQSLDPGFFEEIEDLKFALQQSAMLNKEYEKVLRQMCLRFGIPYPHPEHILSR